MNNDHASNGALLLSYLGAVASWFTQSHVLFLLTAVFTVINIAIGVVRLRRMLKGME
jgi:ABC-type siderophore export system fused ATPase/permease subunit